MKNKNPVDIGRIMRKNTWDLWHITKHMTSFVEQEGDTEWYTVFRVEFLFVQWDRETQPNISWCKPIYLY